MSISYTITPIRCGGAGVGVVSAPNLFSFTRNTTRNVETTRATVVIISTHSNLTINTRGTFGTTSTHKVSGVVITSGVSSRHTSFCGSFGNVTTGFNADIYPVIVPVVASNGIITCCGVVARGTFTCDNTGTAPIRFDRSSTTEFSTVGRMFGRTITNASRRVVSGCFSNRRLATRSGLGNLHVNITSNSMVPIFTLDKLDNRTYSRLLSFVTSIYPTPSSRCTVYSSRPVRLATSTGNSLTTVYFGAITSPFVNGLSFFGILDNGLATNTRVIGTSANRSRELNGVIAVFNTGRASTTRVPTNSVNTTIGLSNFGANSALYGTSGVVGTSNIGAPRTACSVTTGTIGGNSRRGVTLNFTELYRRSPDLGFHMGGRARRRVVDNLNRRRVSITITGLGAGFTISIRLTPPGVTCERAVAGGISTRKHRGGRDNNRNRFNSIFVRFRPYAYRGLRFTREMINNSIPGGFFPTIRGKLGRYVRGNILTNCPVINVGTALCSNSCRPMSSDRVDFGVTTSVTFGRNMAGTNPVLLRPVSAIQILYGSRTVNSIVNSVGGHHNHILKVGPINSNVRRVISRVPSTRVAAFSATVHRVARKENSFASRFTECREYPRRITRGVVSRDRTRWTFTRVGYFQTTIMELTTLLFLVGWGIICSLFV